MNARKFFSATVCLLAAVVISADPASGADRKNSKESAPDPKKESGGKVKPAKIKVTSPAMKQGATVAKDYTGDGRDVSPPIQWSDVPKGTVELALICDDPDAPTKEPWVHWIVYNIPPTMTGLPEGVPAEAEITDKEKHKNLVGLRQGLTGWRKPGYRGPAPPPGKDHHYHFKVYALDAKLNLKPGLPKDKLLEAMEGHIIGEGEIVVLYKR